MCYSIKTGNSKKTWEIINEIRGKEKSKIKPSFIVDGELVKNRRVIANEFNKFFTSIATKMNSESNESCSEEKPIPSDPKFNKYMDKSVSDSIYMSNCSVEEVEIIIKELESGKASDIPIHIIKNCSDIIAPHLTKFYNKFMEIGIFPSILKIGKISPI